MGDRQSGAVVALPIWIDFFSRVIEDKKKKFAEDLVSRPAPEQTSENVGQEAGQAPEMTSPAIEDFEVPPNLVFVTIDRKTGLLASPICKYPFREVFLPGTEPTRYCTPQDHLRVLDYYSEKEAREERH